ncbi:hypothetical protein NLJ89_g10163 [Agrocybe chaxingu]|uniref:DUF6535 domain-containing protein n=1 Tax=Agrocybe chaxingu TaxID=84603 RepID=A0A9W8MSE1_9AGAR|nr:hypothetical protein NLJ89_g10163 [Agrocybe chaxingu]
MESTPLRRNQSSRSHRNGSPTSRPSFDTINSPFLSESSFTKIGTSGASSPIARTASSESANLHSLSPVLSTAPPTFVSHISDEEDALPPAPEAPDSPVLMRFKKRSYSIERLQPNIMPWKSGDLFQHELDKRENDPWDTCYKLARKHDKGMCLAWKEEIDKILTFAGLFAATVVAFLAVSYTLLKPDAADLQNQILYHIAAQIEAYVAHNSSLPGLQNSTLPGLSASSNPPLVAVRMNCVMFLSLTLALITVLVGITCLQWIREYERDARLGPKEAFALRQMRFDGFHYWGVPTMLSFLPVLLQLAVGLFFWGMTEFLWMLNGTVTLIQIIPIGIVFFFAVVTTALPALQSIFINEKDLRGHQCPYKSPPARLFSVLAFWLARIVISLAQYMTSSNVLAHKKAFLEKLAKGGLTDWLTYDTAWQTERLVDLSSIEAKESRDVPRSLAWLARTYVHSREAIAGLYHALREIYPSTSLQTLRKVTRQELDSVKDTWKEQDEEIYADIKAALLLDELVTNNPQLHPPLLHKRTELFVRIVNHEIVELRPHLNIWDFFDALPESGIKLSVPFKKDQNYLLLTDACKWQLLIAFRGYLKKVGWKDKLWDIVRPLIFQTVTSRPLTAESSLLQELNEFNTELQTYFIRIQHLPNGRVVQAHMRAYIKQFDDVRQRGELHLSRRLAGFEETLHSLRSSLDGQAELLNIPPSIGRRQSQRSE